MRIRLGEAAAAVVVCGAVGLYADDALLALSVFVLLAGLKLMWTSDGLFVLPAAYLFHWLETSIGLVYKAFFNREVATFYASNYQPMVLISLGCCLALAIGVRAGMALMSKCRMAGPRVDVRVLICPPGGRLRGRNVVRRHARRGGRGLPFGAADHRHRRYGAAGRPVPGHPSPAVAEPPVDVDRAHSVDRSGPGHHRLLRGISRAARACSTGAARDLRSSERSPLGSADRRIGRSACDWASLDGYPQ